MLFNQFIIISLFSSSSVLGVNVREDAAVGEAMARENRENKDGHFTFDLNKFPNFDTCVAGMETACAGVALSCTVLTGGVAAPACAGLGVACHANEIAECAKAHPPPPRSRRLASKIVSEPITTTLKDGRNVTLSGNMILKLGELNRALNHTSCQNKSWCLSENHLASCIADGRLVDITQYCDGKCVSTGSTAQCVN